MPSPARAWPALPCPPDRRSRSPAAPRRPSSLRKLHIVSVGGKDRPGDAAFSTASEVWWRWIEKLLRSLGVRAVKDRPPTRAIRHRALPSTSRALQHSSWQQKECKLSERLSGRVRSILSLLPSRCRLRTTSPCNSARPRAVHVAARSILAEEHTAGRAAPDSNGFPKNPPHPCTVVLRPLIPPPYAAAAISLSLPACAARDVRADLKSALGRIPENNAVHNRDNPLGRTIAFSGGRKFPGHPHRNSRRGPDRVHYAQSACVNAL